MHHAESSNLQLKNNTKYRNFKIAAAGSTAALVLGGLAFLQPFSFTNNSYAEEAEKSSSAEMSVTVEPVIEIWTTDTNDDTISAANIELDPDESIATTTVRTHVSTSNTTGYTLTIQSESTDAKMTHEDSTITKTINPITGEGTSTTNWTKNKDLNNMWGYSIGSNDSFLGVPGSSSNTNTINETSGPSNDSSTDVTFAAKADTTLPAGTYKDTVIFSAIANPQTVTLKEAAEAAGITTMQTMTRDVCASADIYQEGDEDLTLKDSRDQKEYKIRKLADGNCWMVQNLRLVGSRSLSSSDTNVSSGFTLPASSTSGWCTTSNDTACDGTARVLDTSNTEYGAYYNWYAATAGTGTYSKSSGSVDASICPKSGDGNTSDKSWHLPTGNTNGEWYNLLSNSIYGITYLKWDGANTRRDFTDATITGITNTYGNFTPNLPFSGYRRGSSTDGQSSTGYWWSSTAYDSDYAYYAQINSSGYMRAGTNNYIKYNGVSIRCVLTGVGD